MNGYMSPCVNQAMQRTPQVFNSTQSNFDLSTFQHDAVPLRSSQQAFEPLGTPNHYTQVYNTPVITKHTNTQSLQQPSGLDTQSVFKCVSLTPNPKQGKQKSQVELDFKSLQNYVLSNIDSDSDKQDSGDLVQSDSDQEQMGAALTNPSVKPWTLPVAETPFKVKN